DVRFVAPAGARLLWLPPGRRGEPEYVPAAALSSQPAAEARFDHPDRSLPDAAAALAIVVIVAALALWLARARLRALPRAVALGMLAVLALALVVRLDSLGGEGQTWDEDTYWSAGRNDVDNLVGGDLHQDAWIWNYQHPPVTKYLAGVGAWWSGGYRPARAVSAIVMSLACVLLVPIGARLHRPSTGIAAGLVAALTPHLVAHGQIVGHEAPTALAWALAWWTSLRVWDGIGEKRAPGTATATGAEDQERTVLRTLIARMAIVGAVLGAGIMVRFVNVLAAPAIGATILLGAPRTRRAQAIAVGLAVIPIAAALTSIVLWPRLWWDPIGHLQAAWAKLKQPHSAEPFLGTITNEPPGWYFVVYLFATAPLGLLVAAVAGKLSWLRDRARWPALLIAAAWAIAPLGVAFSPVRQDGVRYVIPTLLVLALLAGAGVVALGELVGRRWPRPPSLRAVPAALLVAYLAIVCVRIRPYYLDYYGEQVGGTAGVARARRFEVAWWGEGLAAAIDYVNAHAAPGDRVHRSCVEPIHLTWFRGDLWEPVADPRAARWIVHYQPSWRPCPIPPNAVRVFSARAGGARLVDVYRVDPS
ncbi:MAG TPA: glycosyltransferase family 39 protein, partial [Kofleriaceae bacterium]|nr:glycosyltransferase family 39 protein [Kofleriaceae bacterium]